LRSLEKEEELLKRAAAHANDHGYKEEIMTPEIQQTSNH
jgi:hypothetical protein